VFSYPRTLKTWHYPHLLLYALLQRGAAAAPTVQQVINVSYLPGCQQQTRRTLSQRANGRQEGRTEGHRTVSEALLRVLYGQC